MKKVFSFFMATALVAVMSACSITLPVDATSNEVGSKVGRSSGAVLFGAIVVDDDAGIQAAAKDGGITKISTVDIRTTSILGYL
jgi:hypothetical protein